MSIDSHLHSLQLRPYRWPVQTAFTQNERSNMRYVRHSMFLSDERQIEKGRCSFDETDGICQVALPITVWHDLKGSAPEPRYIHCGYLHRRNKPNLAGEGEKGNFVSNSKSFTSTLPVGPTPSVMKGTRYRVFVSLRWHNTLAAPLQFPLFWDRDRVIIWTSILDDYPGTDLLAVWIVACTIHVA